LQQYAMPFQIHEKGNNILDKFNVSLIQKQNRLDPVQD